MGSVISSGHQGDHEQQQHKISLASMMRDLKHPHCSILMLGDDRVNVSEAIAKLQQQQQTPSSSLSSPFSSYLVVINPINQILILVLHHL